MIGIDNLYKREPLKGPIQLIHLDSRGEERSIDIEDIELIGEGNSCLVYSVVAVISKDEPKRRMIMKEFYPERNIRMVGEGAERRVENLDLRPEIKELFTCFEKAYKTQRELVNKESLKHIVVEPLFLTYGKAKKTFLSQGKKGGRFALYDADYGKSLDKVEHLDFEYAIYITYEIAKALEALHEEKIIYMDLKPQNILFFGDEKNGRIKLLDFDASIRMDELNDLKSIRAQGDISLIAPKLRMIDFNTQKELIHPNVDLFSLGAILFRYIFGRDLGENEYISSDRKSKEIFKNLLQKFFSEPRNQKYNEIIRKKLLRIFNNTLCSYRGYVSAKDLIKDMEDILSEFKLLQRPERLFLLSSYIINKYPLYDYLHFDAEETAIDVCILGGSQIGDLRDAFFKSIFSSAQLINTPMNIRFVGRDARFYKESLLEKCPMLSSSTYIFDNGQNTLGTLNRSITDRPFANLFFETVDQNVDIKSTLKNIPSRYFIILDEEILKDVIEEIKELTAEKKEKRFICYPLSREGKQIKGNKYIDLFSFYILRNLTQEHDDFETESMRRAYLVHRYYKRQFDERISEEEIQKNFYSDFYNIESSLRSATSIPYKLYSCGIPYNQKASYEFYQKVLNEKDPNTEKIRNEMIYLEHRSWMCYMIASGHKKPTEEQLKAYFYTGENSHRNKEEKFHPLICESRSDNPVSLRNLPKKEWKKITDNSNILSTYDLLDQMSFYIHDLCEKKSQEIRPVIEGKIDELLYMTEKESFRYSANKNKQIKDKIQFSKILLQKMFGSEQNINSTWNRHYKDLKNEIEEREYLNKNIPLLLEEIEKKMLVVKQKNLFVDYKYVDFDLIQGIPMLLWDKQIHTLYKFFDEKELSRNIISVILLEPKKMVLIVENEELKKEHEDKLKCMEEFLKEKRGMSTLDFRICTLDTLSVNDNDVLSIFDVTNAPHKIRCHKNLSKLPYIEYPLDSKKDTDLSEIDFFVQKKSLTVEETFPFYNAEVVSDKKKNLMLSFADNYNKLWNGYSNTNRMVWHYFCEKVEEVCENDRKGEAFRSQTADVVEKTYKSDVTNLFEIKIAGIDELLEDLKSEGLILGYELPRQDVYRSAIRITTKYPEDINKLNDWIKKAKIGNSRFAFNRNSKKIVEENMLFEKSIEIPSQDHVKLKGKLKPQLERIIDILYDKKLDEDQQKFVRRIDGKDFVVERNNYCCDVNFEFVSSAAKAFFEREGNALEVYAYHSIVQETSVFDDVKLNVELKWNDWKSKSGSRPIDNEIDIVCTKELQTFLISCKQSKPEAAFLYQIGYHASKFGINTKAIIICSRKPQGREESEYKALIRRSDEMGVYFIESDMIKDLPKYIENIANNKRDWRSIQ